MLGSSGKRVCQRVPTCLFLRTSAGCFEQAKSKYHSFHSTPSPSFDKTGITPDIVAEMSKENNAVFTTLEQKDDNVLATAIEHIKNAKGLEIKD